ncbi:hypothetical protein YC2023_011480 [Brassica napus]
MDVKGKFEKGKRYMVCRHWNNDMAELEKCWKKIRWSLYEYYLVQEEQYERNL